jgi:hypothetical protein
MRDFDLLRTARRRSEADESTRTDDQQRLADLLPQGVRELDNLRALDGAGEEPEIEALEGDAGDDRELMPIEVMPQNGCFALGRPGAHRRGALAQSGFVDEDDDSSLFRSVF